MKQPTNDRRLTWLSFENSLSLENVITFSENLYSQKEFQPVKNPSVVLSGGSLGFNLTGDINQIKADLSEISKADFHSYILKGILPNSSNFTFTISFVPGTGQISLHGTSGTQEVFERFLEITQNTFPESFYAIPSDLEERATRLAAILREGEKVATSNEEAIKWLKEIEKAKAKSTSLLEESQKAKAEILRIKSEATTKDTEIKSTAAQISIQLTQTTTARDDTKVKKDEVTALEAQIRQFFSEIEKVRSTVNTTAKKAETVIEEANTKTKEIITENENIQVEIKDHLLKAVGVGLFNAFETRKKSIRIAKWIWAIAAAIAIFTQTILILWLATLVKEIDPQIPFYLAPSFILRVTACIPIIFFIGYAIYQYAKERQLEEMYGFKASLSFSLSPYLDLVQQLDKDKGSQEHMKFVIETIKQIFENPLYSKGSQLQNVDKPFVNDILDRAIKLIETGIKH